MKTYLILALCITSLSDAAPPSSAAVAPKGTVVVTVKDSAGAFAPALTLFYHRVPLLMLGASSLAPGEFNFSGSLATATGASQTDLPVGRYLVCVDPGTTSFLDPCKWATAISVNVVAGQSTPVSITLSKGVRLQVSISDPKHLLPPDRRPAGPPPATVGVFYGRGAFQAAGCSMLSGTLTCSTSIPTGVPFRLWVVNPTLGFAADDGTTVDSSGVGPAFQATTGIDQQFHFTVSGSKLSGSTLP